MAYFLELVRYQRHAIPYFTWDDEDNFPEFGHIAFGLSSGFWVDPQAIPKSAYQERDKRVPDVFPMPGCNAVNQRFKDLVEEFEPGVHQFMPIELRNKAGEPLTDNYYVFNCMVSVDTVLVKESGLQWEIDEPSGQSFLDILTFKHDMVLSRPAVGDRHLWQGLYLQPISSGGVFCSDAFQKELKKRKIRFLDQKHCAEADVVWTPEDNIQPILDWEAVHGLHEGHRSWKRAQILKERGRLEL
ncbi:MAG: imm11 family protein [Labrenzia sp.]